MRIRINDLYLAEGGAQSPSGLSMEGAPSTQRSDSPRAGGPSFFDRKVRAHTESFTVGRLHRTLSEAEHFLRSHAKALDADAVGTIEFIAEGDAGGAAGKWKAPGRLVGYSARHIGVTTVHTYTIEYGALS